MGFHFHTYRMVLCEMFNCWSNLKPMLKFQAKEGSGHATGLYMLMVIFMYVFGQSSIPNTNTDAVS